MFFGRFIFLCCWSFGWKLFRWDSGSICEHLIHFLLMAFVAPIVNEVNDCASTVLDVLLFA